MPSSCSNIFSSKILPNQYLENQARVSVSTSHTTVTSENPDFRHNKVEFKQTYPKGNMYNPGYISYKLKTYGILNPKAQHTDWFVACKKFFKVQVQKVSNLVSPLEIKNFINNSFDQINQEYFAIKWQRQWLKLLMVHAGLQFLNKENVKNCQSIFEALLEQSELIYRQMTKKLFKKNCSALKGKNTGGFFSKSLQKIKKSFSSKQIQKVNLSSSQTIQINQASEKQIQSVLLEYCQYIKRIIQDQDFYLDLKNSLPLLQRKHKQSTRKKNQHQQAKSKRINPQEIGVSGQPKIQKRKKISLNCQQVFYQVEVAKKAPCQIPDEDQCRFEDINKNYQKAQQKFKHKHIVWKLINLMKKHQSIYKNFRHISRYHQKISKYTYSTINFLAFDSQFLYVPISTYMLQQRSRIQEIYKTDILPLKQTKRQDYQKALLKFSLPQSPLQQLKMILNQLGQINENLTELFNGRPHHDYIVDVAPPFNFVGNNSSKLDRIFEIIKLVDDLSLKKSRSNSKSSVQRQSSISSMSINLSSKAQKNGTSQLKSQVTERSNISTSHNQQSSLNTIKVVKFKQKMLLQSNDKRNT